MLFVAAEEILDPEDGRSSNMTEPGDKVDPSFVLLSESPHALKKINDPKYF